MTSQGSAPIAPSVIHFGPSTDYVGGMASVIDTLTRSKLGAGRASAVATWVPGSHIRSAVLAVRAAAGLRRAEPGTAVHVHMSEGGSFLREGLVVAAARYRRLRCVVTIHGSGFAQFAAAHRSLVARVLGMADAVTVLSSVDLETVRAVVPRTQAQLVPNPVAVRAGGIPVEDTDEVVLFAGEVGPRKGADVLARAWPIVAKSRPRARCVLVGPATTLDLPDQDRFRVVGPVSHAQVLAMISTARLVVLPSRGEALPMVLAEAMASARPFVSTPTGGIPALAAGGVIVPIDDHEQLAAALIRLLDDEAEASALGLAGQRLCARWMSFEAVGDALAPLYTGGRQA